MAFRRLGDLIGRYIGIGGATGDATNPLSVRGAGALFDGDSGGHQVRINKSGVSDTASFLFQRGFSGRAEFGLIGNDNFELKVSADGSAFNQAFIVDDGTAVTDFKQQPTYLGAALYSTSDFTLSDVARRSGGNTFTGAQTFQGSMNVTAAGSFESAFTTTDASLHDVGLRIGGARTASSSSDIAYVKLANTTAENYDLAQIVAQDPSANSTLENGRLIFRTSASGTLTDALLLNSDNTAAFYGEVTISGATVWHADNDGAGSGLDADLLDGNQASAFAFLTGATFTGGVTATTFSGNGSSLTNLNASNLASGTVPAARLPAVTNTADQHANATGNWHTFVNDGGGNIGMRWNATPGGTNTLVEGNATAGGHAWMLRIDNDNALGDLFWRRGSTATSQAGETITWDNWLVFDGGLDRAEWFKDLDLNNNDLVGVGVTNTSQLGVGGATPDATNTFAFYGTDLLLNSGGSINMKYNKNAAGDDASMTFQSGFTTYGLFGLLGNNDVTLKVGTGFTTAMIADNTDGTVSFPEGVRHDTVTAYKTSSQTLTGTGTWDDIASWDGTHIAASGNLSWTASTGQAFVGKAGRFLVSYSLSTEISTGSSRSDSLAKLQKWNGSSWVDVEGTEHRMYNRVSGRGGSNASWSGVLDLTGSEGLKVVATVETGTDTIIVDQVSLSISRM
ncbi:hypothetical protein FDH38_gp041 [Dinoroseobacter phage vB_DshS-R5C]|uniref:Uncharacterized protein n=1 Tax=Dinoroseobacter phage vB_DshS-R5C TaxID=1965368 RepID=A0A1V0DY63_9CAUD|nr:hypothetical protein FDH38_gp041 [Dinoroseobacter phage vB_DshS-R5C]ARB06095.1 hypothetical protein vBDshSR5C_41 [Dinoroseobacter phage vB_DshS-R5C]